MRSGGFLITRGMFIAYLVVFLLGVMLFVTIGLLHR